MKQIICPSCLIRPVIRCTTRRNPIYRLSIVSQRRSASSDQKSEPSSMHPILQEYYSKRPAQLQKAIEGKDGSAKPEFGSMPEETVFDVSDTQPIADLTTKEDAAATTRDELQDGRSLDALNILLDPMPHKRWQFERQRIISNVRKGWRMTKEENLLRTERRSASNSAPLKTSVKKLGALARQISGKSIDEALLQLRFSKKRTANEVIEHLKMARDHAIVRWGMNLGEIENRKGEPVTLKLKNGKKRHVTDRTSLYIEHAMVRRAKPDKIPEYRARGRMNILKRRFTSLRIVLREEHTRIRETQEREERKLRKAPFTPLADRPLTQQRQYVLW